MKVKYLQTMDFEFKNVIVLNCDNEEELINKIEESKIIKINNLGTVEYINSNYIMFFEI